MKNRYYIPNLGLELKKVEANNMEEIIGNALGILVGIIPLFILIKLFKVKLTKEIEDQDILTNDANIFDLSSTYAKAKLTIACNAPSAHHYLTKYQIKINNYKTIEIPKNSTCEITLNPSEYTIQIKPKEFGKPLVYKVNLKIKRELLLNYKGPLFIWTKGTIK